MGWIVLGIFCGFVLGFFGLVGYLELGYRIGRRRRQRKLVECQLNSYLNGCSELDSRERRKLVDGELKRLRR